MEPHEKTGPLSATTTVRPSRLNATPGKTYAFESKYDHECSRTPDSIVQIDKLWKDAAATVRPSGEIATARTAVPVKMRLNSIPDGSYQTRMEESSAPVTAISEFWLISIALMYPAWPVCMTNTGESGSCTENAKEEIRTNDRAIAK
jgi:hypothetical protein